MLVSTAWIALALGTQKGEAARAARSRALEKLSTEKEGQSTEWVVTRLLLAIQSKDERRTANGVERLRQGQRTNGGWGWLLEDEGDAFGTGLVLHALGRAGVAADDDAVRRGVQFLVATQQADGSWPVPGTKRKAKGRVVETSRYWGTCWAVLGLLDSRAADRVGRSVRGPSHGMETPRSREPGSTRTREGERQFTPNVGT